MPFEFLDAIAAQSRPACHALSPGTQVLLLEHYQPGGRLEYVERLQEQIHGLENEIRLLKQRQNHISLPNRLPMEILSEIFQIHSERMLMEYGYIIISRQIRLTHVCQHWRTVALDCAAFWAQPAFGAQPELTQLMLDRSKNAKLSIQFRRNDASHNTILSDTLLQTDRLRQVEVTCNDGNKFDVSPFLARLATSSRFLQRLHLEAKGTQKIKLSSDFTLGGATVLTHLALIRINFQLDNIPLGPTLTSLLLTPSRRRVGIAATWPKIRRALSMAPNLVRLEIKNLLPDGKLPEEFETNPLNMDTLEYIVVEDTFLAIGELFSMLRAPLTLETDFLITFTDKGEADVIDRCLANFRGLAKDSQDQMDNFGIQKLQLGSSPFAAFSIKGRFHRPGESEADRDWDWDDLRFRFHVVDDAMMKAFMTAMKTHLGLHALWHLTIWNSWMPLPVLVHSFADLPALQHIKTTGKFEHIVDLLAQDPAQGVEEDEDTETQEYFPSLCSLHFSNPKLGAPFPDVNEFICALDCRPPSRQIERLNFEGCSKSFSATYPKAIRAAFPYTDVDWECEQDTDVDEGMEADEAEECSDNVSS